MEYLNTYSQYECLLLIKYYSDKVINHPQNLNHKISIYKLEPGQFDDGTYRIICIHRYPISGKLYRDLYLVAKEWGLPLPKEVLKNYSI